MDGLGDLFRGLGELFGGLGEAASEPAAEMMVDGAVRGEATDASSPYERVLAGAKRVLNINDV